ncbi:MAG: dienelactone hydrolase, partial [Streptococcaceae bacterium]|nr:dienelactone hydrolase [Streptococcaceae bacterium]
MTEIFRMPDVGEGMHEGEIASWLIKVGDVVKEEDAIAEIQNDKLLQEILSPYSGKVTKLFVEAGTVVEVGAPLIEFDGDGTGVAAGVASSTLVEVAATSEVTKTADQALSPASTPTEEGSVGVGVGREKENAAPVIN